MQLIAFIQKVKYLLAKKLKMFLRHFFQVVMHLGGKNAYKNNV